MSPKPYLLDFDFERFCTLQLISPSDKDKFRAWLGSKARNRYTQAKWTALWDEFRNSSLDLQIA